MRNLLLIAVVALSTTGCGIIYKQPIYQGNLLQEKSVAQLQAGQSKQQVNALLGTPSIPDPFHAQRWDYTSSQRVNRLGKTEVKNFTVFFENDRVTRWEGDYFPNQDAELAQKSVRQFGRNLAKDKKKRGGR
ncbi:outer membrane protein assembly factor BamE [Stenotrophomonas nitritireducens]|uniref:outer membrane protein assembly factor BamE n=1 Tax=Stenotrophomonas nitritireducens TaxID=83617 RepID=UPI003D972986